MAYKLFDKDSNVVSHHDLQDKGLWCKIGSTKEEVFVEKFGRELHLSINPEKQRNPYAPDLLNTSSHLLGDLKTQNTPFFQAKARFNLDPQFVVVFNGKDRLRYLEHYPYIEIYFAIDWQVVRFEGREVISVLPMKGVWFIPFQDLNLLLEKSPFHAYQQRTKDQNGNAKGSYVLDLKNPAFRQIV